MKILMLGWELPPHNSGGLGVACYQLCKALAQKGADIEFVLPYSAKHEVPFMRVSAAVPQDVSVVQLAGTAYSSREYQFSDGHSESIDIFGQQQLFEHGVDQYMRRTTDTFDVIHAHDWLTFRAALRAKQQTGLPLIVHFHSVERDRAGGGVGNPLVREIEEMALMMADRVIAVSQHTKDMIVQDYDIPASKIQVVHNSIDKEMLEPLEEDSAYAYLTALKAQGYHVVTSLSRLALQKNLVNLLYAAKEVIAREPKTVFLIVGSGEQYFELIALSAELAIAKNVVFTGFQRGKKWRDAYAIADLFVMPSISEPFGLTALEAIAYGAPVLMSHQSGVSEVIHNALKIDFWDVHEMANQIVAAMQNASLRHVLHANALQEFEKLSWSKPADLLLGVYQTHTAGAQA